jgi:hypothetical protein
MVHQLNQNARSDTIVAQEGDDSGNRMRPLGARQVISRIVTANVNTLTDRCIAYCTFGVVSAARSNPAYCTSEMLWAAESVICGAWPYPSQIRVTISL